MYFIMKYSVTEYNSVTAAALSHWVALRILLVVSEKIFRNIFTPQANTVTTVFLGAGQEPSVFADHRYSTVLFGVCA